MDNRRLFNVSGAIAIFAASICSSACGSDAKTANATEEKQPTIVDVTTTQVIVRQIPAYFEATGNLASDAATDVAPAIAGKVVEVNFDVGSYVTKGSVLLRLDPRDAQIRLETAQAQVQQQQKALEQAIAALRQAQARLGVKDGETFDIEKFSQVKSVRANLELAEKELLRAERLYSTGDISKAALDGRRAQRDALLGQLDEARSNAAVAVKAIKSAEAQVGSARAAIATAKTQVLQARKSLADTAVLAPISGYISDRSADLGEFISPNVPNAKIATIVRTSSLRLKIDVPEASIGKVAIGQSISLQTSAYPDRKFAGRVVRISPSLNQQARTLSVEAEVPNGDGLLKPGQFATVRITQAVGENALMIPTVAVITERDLNKVFVVKDGVARERLIQVGLLEGDTIQVKQGLSEGEVIATSNLSELYDGVQVRSAN